MDQFVRGDEAPSAWQRHAARGEVISFVRPAGVRRRFVTSRGEMGDGLLSAEDGVVAQLAFGGIGQIPPSSGDWPTLWVQGDVRPGIPRSGMQALVLDGIPLRRITLGGRVVGSVWSDQDADYCLLAGVLPVDPAADRGVQTQSCFEQIESALAQGGFLITDLVRTWLYLDRLLEWYDQFNAVRTAFFRERGLFDHLIPASTGIGAGNPAGAALAAGALAVRPRHDGVRAREIASPRQGAASDYRSSFSRAVELDFPDRRLLLVSGTASIAADGRTLHQGDIVAQIHQTLDVVAALLASRRLDWRDTCRAVAYFRDISAVAVFEACCRERGLPDLPLVTVEASVCRDDLLFEIELDAWTDVPAPDAAP